MPNNTPKEEYEEHYSPDGEKLEYMMEHPELNMTNTSKADWEEEFIKKFACKNENCCNGKNLGDYFRVKHFINFISQTLERERAEIRKEIEEVLKEDDLYGVTREWLESLLSKLREKE